MIAVWLFIDIGNSQTWEYYDNWLIQPGHSGNATGIKPSGGGIMIDGNFNTAYGTNTHFSADDCLLESTEEKHWREKTESDGRPPMVQVQSLPLFLHESI